MNKFNVGEKVRHIGTEKGNHKDKIATVIKVVSPGTEVFPPGDEDSFKIDEYHYILDIESIEFPGVEIHAQERFLLPHSGA